MNQHPDPMTLISLANKVAATHTPGGLSFQFGFLEPSVHVMGRDSLAYIFDLPGEVTQVPNGEHDTRSIVSVMVNGVKFYTLAVVGGAQ